MLTEVDSFSTWFQQATGHAPYAYQRDLALREGPVPKLLRLPTGSGKTEAILGLWLWRRLNPSAGPVPRRLVYILPMRVLVEQTVKIARAMLDGLGCSDQIKVHVIMGGEEGVRPDEWIAEPECPAILVGTQDMLLSRALNRGYAQSRAAWPRSFGLLHNDCYWVLDEIQLMGNSLATSVQLAAFREQLGTAVPVWVTWMSATASRSWLASVDHAAPAASDCFDLGAVQPEAPLLQRLRAPKTLYAAPSLLKHDAASQLAVLLRNQHQPGTLTLTVVNTIDLAIEVYRSLQPRVGSTRGAHASTEPLPELLLLHSRFRQAERERQLQLLTKFQEQVPPAGVIIVSTQVIEAGVDLDAATLVTQLAPWASIVQRLGRLNRAGQRSTASAWWFALDGEDDPYDAAQLGAARELLLTLEGQSVAPGALEGKGDLPYQPSAVLRRRDLEGLFDTTPDLTEIDLDISLFIRESDDLDLFVFWRDWTGPETLSFPDAAAEGELDEGDLFPSPLREELCRVSLSAFRQALGQASKRDHPLVFFIQEGPRGVWRRATKRDLYPGQRVLLPASAGYYSSAIGWDPAATAAVPLVGAPSSSADTLVGDPQSEADSWLTLAEHTDAVVATMERQLAALPAAIVWQRVLLLAARWHDWGKAHPDWQRRLPLTAAPIQDTSIVWAKWKKSKDAPRTERDERRYLRHELASALALFQQPEVLQELPEEWQRDLVRYLVASHHGKVRVAPRALPGEGTEGNQPLVLGIAAGDTLPAVDLGGGIVAPAVTLSLEPLKLGGSAENPSWTERVLRLVADHLGPFRLAYLEALLRAADCRASAQPSSERIS